MSDNEAKRDRVLKEALECRVQLLAYARSLLGNHASAEDSVQEAMLVVVKKHDQFQDGTSMLAWCRSIVRLEVLRANHQRGRDRSLAQRLLDDAVDAAFDAHQIRQRRSEEDELHEQLASCLQGVTDRGRELMRARYVDGLSYPHIAERVGMTLEAVRKSLFRLKKQVRQCVELKMRGAQ